MAETMCMASEIVSLSPAEARDWDRVGDFLRANTNATRNQAIETIGISRSIFYSALKKAIAAGKAVRVRAPKQQTVGGAVG